MRRILCSTGEVAETYQQYLKTKHWRNKRKQFLESDYFRGHCSMCPNDGVMHIHHITYKNVGNEPLTDLVAVCGECHAKLHTSTANLEQYIQPENRIKKKKPKSKKKMLKEKARLGYFKELGVSGKDVARDPDKRKKKKKTSKAKKEWLKENDKPNRPKIILNK